MAPAKSSYRIASSGTGARIHHRTKAAAHTGASRATCADHSAPSRSYSAGRTESVCDDVSTMFQYESNRIKRVAHEQYRRVGAKRLAAAPLGPVRLDEPDAAVDDALALEPEVGELLRERGARERVGAGEDARRRLEEGAE